LAPKIFIWFPEVVHIAGTDSFSRKVLVTTFSITLQEKKGGKKALPHNMLSDAFLKCLFLICWDLSFCYWELLWLWDISYSFYSKICCYNF